MTTSKRRRVKKSHSEPKTVEKEGLERTLRSSDSVPANASELNEKPSRRSRDPDSTTLDASEPAPLVWRAVIIGAAVALVLVLIPSYIAVPKLAHTDLTAVKIGPDGHVTHVSRLELPPFSAGLARSKSEGEVLVAIPSQRKIERFQLEPSPGPISETSAPAGPRSGFSFVKRDSVAIQGTPLALTSSPPLDIAIVIENASSSVSVLDLSASEVTRSVSVGQRPVAAAISDSHAIAALSNLDSGSVTLIDLPSYAAKEVGVGDRPRSLAFLGPSLFVAREGQSQLTVVDALSATQAGVIDISMVPSWIETCGGWLVAADTEKPRLAIVDPANPPRIGFVDIPGRSGVLRCLEDGRLVAGVQQPPGISLLALSTSGSAESPTAEPLGFLETSAVPNFVDEISPGIVAASGARLPSTLMTSMLVSANLFGVLVGGFVTGVLARRRYGVHSVAVAGVLAASYWVVFQGAQVAALPFVVVFVGIPVLATTASGVWIGKIVVERGGLFGGRSPTSDCAPHKQNPPKRNN